MNTLVSTEVRWFGPGVIPQDLRSWFEGLGPGLVQKDPNETRPDFYLFLANVDDLGIKVRENGKAVELKKRTRDDGIRQFGLKSRGRVGQWIKWSFPPRDETGAAGVAGHNEWVKVEKQRWKLKIPLTSAGGAGKPEGGDTMVKGPGCAVELTQLRVNNADWWTIGFESFEKDSALEPIAVDLLGRTGTPSLDENDSYDYPKWVSNLRGVKSVP